MRLPKDRNAANAVPDILAQYKINKCLILPQI